jgi:hypothetical protein
MAMEGFNIAIIPPIDFKIEDVAKPDDVEQFYDHVKYELITSIEGVTSDMMFMERLVTNIGLIHNPTLKATTITIKEDDKYIYQYCHLSMTENNLKETEPVNMLASILHPNKEKVHGNVVLFKMEIQEDRTCLNFDFTKEDTIQIINEKFFPTGYLIKSNGDMISIMFKDHIMEIVDEETKKKYCEYEIPLMKFNILAYFDKDATEPNVKATRLAGNLKIAGDCYFTVKSTDNEFIPLEGALIEHLLLLAEGPLSKRELSEEELEDVKKEEGSKPVVNNRYLLVKQRIELYKPRCDECFSFVSKKKFCGKCHRVKYCDKKCQAKHWKAHKPDCLA